MSEERTPYGVSYIAVDPKAGDVVDFNDGTILQIPANVQRFREITEHMAKTYAAKNDDYGNSFSESVEKYGPIAGIVRLSDKFHRAENLILNKSQKVSDESIIDTLIDAACYNIMLAMEIEKKSL